MSTKLKNPTSFSFFLFLVFTVSPQVSKAQDGATNLATGAKLRFSETVDLDLTMAPGSHISARHLVKYREGSRLAPDTSLVSYMGKRVDPGTACELYNDVSFDPNRPESRRALSIKANEDLIVDVPATTFGRLGPNHSPLLGALQLLTARGRVVKVNCYRDGVEILATKEALLAAFGSSLLETIENINPEDLHPKGGARIFAGDDEENGDVPGFFRANFSNEEPLLTNASGI